MTVLATYKYTYGAGSQPNRQIDFVETKDSQNGIQAIVKACTEGVWTDISCLSGQEINVEMMSTSDKVRAFQQERAGGGTWKTPDRTLAQMETQQQQAILSQLEPIGPWRIEITNGFGSDPRIEKVVHLNLFNSS